MTRNAELEEAKRSAEDAKEAETRYVLLLLNSSR
jgi:hypothetical protein